MVTPELLALEKDAILRLGEKHGARNIRVFGSVARGENTEVSDLDLLVEMDRGRNLFDLAAFVADVEDLVGSRVDVVTPGGLRYLKRQILAEAVPL